jgi:hypothetical protein
MNSNGQEDVLVVHEVFRALALSIVHFNTTEYQQVNNSQDNQYTATQIHNYYHSSRSVTRNGHFNLEDLQHALYYHVIRQALKNVCPSIFEWPFQYEQSFELRINGEKVKSRKLCYNSASYESNITNLKISLGIRDVPLDVIYTALYDRLISEYYLLKDKKALKDKEKLDKPIASRTRNSSSSGSTSSSSSFWSSISSSNSSKPRDIIIGIRKLTDTNCSSKGLVLAGVFSCATGLAHSASSTPARVYLTSTAGRVFKCGGLHSLPRSCFCFSSRYARICFLSWLLRQVFELHFPSINA